MTSPAPVPITIITGFLGSGKTTLILSLLPQLPRDYKLALLKNEFGNVATDSLLASSASISATTELLNGCICCNLVGQLGPALTELLDSHAPSRIVIETSGSAFPATLAMEVVRFAREGAGKGRVTLDGVVVVVDCEEWKGYADTSYTAKMQAKWTDLVVLNKWESVGERRMDEVLDRLGDLEVEMPIVRSQRGKVEMGIVFGVDSGLAKTAGEWKENETNGHDGHEHTNDHQSEVDVLSISLRTEKQDFLAILETDALLPMLKSAPKDEVYRIKAVLRSKSLPPSSESANATTSPEKTDDDLVILNWAFGRWTFTKVSGNAASLDRQEALRMTVVLARDSGNKWKKKLEQSGWFALAGSGSDLSVEKII